MKTNQLISVSLIILFIVALILRLIIPLCGELFLIKNAIVLDDAFIALSIARNFFFGNGYSFNGIELTTLTTTLWTLVLSVFGFLSKDMLLMFSSALGGAFFVFSALLFYLILKKIFNRIDVPLIIITFFLFSPFSILISLNALETSFFIFFLMLIFWFYISFIRKKNFSLVRILILNILLFILILTREEGYLVFLALFFDLLFLKVSKKFIAVFLLVFIFFTVPQFVYRFLLFGNPLPSSLNALLKSPWLSKHGILLQRLGVAILNLNLLNTELGSIFLAFLGFLSFKKRQLFNLLPLFLYALLNFLFYSLAVPIGNFRYTFPTSIVLTIGIGGFFYFLKERLEIYFNKSFAKIILYSFSLIFFGLLSLSAFMIWTNVRYGGDGEILWANRDIYFYHVARFLNENTPKNSRIIASHIGTLQYFLEDRIVLDAGGKVDYEAGSYFNDKEKYFDYFEKKNASYIVHVLSPKQFESINKTDILYYEPIYAKPNEPLAYLKGMSGDYIENYIVVLKFKRNYLNFFLPS